MNTPLVSICIPTYNGEKFLEVCLDSAIHQSYHNIEIIISDDCSSDATLNIVTKYMENDSRVKLHKNEKNLGLVGNWNKCIELSSGEWIKYLFQDDYLSLDCIEKMTNAISENDKIITSGRRLLLDETLGEAAKNYSINETLTFPKLGIISTKPVFISAKKIADFTVKNICINFVGEPTVIMFKKDVIHKLGYFSTELIQICDLEYFLRIATNYGIKYIPEPLTYYRSHTGSTSSANWSKRYFSMMYIDRILTLHDMLYSGFFSHFRKLLSWPQKIKLKLYLAVSVNKALHEAATSYKEGLKEWEALIEKYPVVGNYKIGDRTTSFIMTIVKLRRAVKKLIS